MEKAGIAPDTMSICTSGPQGPLYLELPNGEGIEIVKVIRDNSTQLENPRVCNDCFEHLKIDEETIVNFYRKAKEMAHKWD